MINYIRTASSYIKSKWNHTPEIAIILGTGLGGVADDIQKEAEIFYRHIPGFPISTAPGHNNKLICGTLHGRKVIAFQGRFHAYEGHPFQAVVFPVYVAKELGCKILFLTCACGALNLEYKVGDLMVFKDHINLM